MYINTSHLLSFNYYIYRIQIKIIFESLPLLGNIFSDCFFGKYYLNNAFFWKIVQCYRSKYLEHPRWGGFSRAPCPPSFFQWGTGVMCFGGNFKRHREIERTLV